MENKTKDNFVPKKAQNRNTYSRSQRKNSANKRDYVAKKKEKEATIIRKEVQHAGN